MPKKANSVSKRGQNRSLTESLLLTTCVVSLMLPATAATGRMPKHPLICGSTEKDSPAIWRTPEKPDCSTLDTEDDQLAITVEGVLYKRNLVAWESTAIQCARYRQVYTTQTSFFTEVNTLQPPVSPIAVTREECETMRKNKDCRAGRLEEGDGVYYTQNPSNYAYTFCCRPYEFIVEQCTLLETKVFNKHVSNRQ